MNHHLNLWGQIKGLCTAVMPVWEAPIRTYPYATALKQLQAAIDRAYAERRALLPKPHPWQDAYHTIKGSALSILAAAFLLTAAVGGALQAASAAHGTRTLRQRVEQQEAGLRRQLQQYVRPAPSAQLQGPPAMPLLRPAAHLLRTGTCYSC